MALWRMLSLALGGAAIAIVGTKLLQSSPADPLASAPSATPLITPVPSPGTLFPRSDGYIGREASPPELWDTIRSSLPTVNLMTDPQGSAPYLRQQTPEAHYDILRRAVFQFDTDALPKSPSPTSAHLEVYVNSLSDTLGNQAVVVTSYDNQGAGREPLSDPILLKNITPKSVLTLPLHVQGLTQIRKNGVTQFALTLASDQTSTEPIWIGQQKEAYLNIDFVEGPHPPRLVTTHASSP